MTKIQLIEEPIDKAIAAIVNGQNQAGGYNYGFRKKAEAGGQPRTEMTVTSWQCQALKSAYSSGNPTPGIKQAIEQAIKCLQNELHVDGQGFSCDDHRQEGASQSMTAAGTLCLQLLDAGKSKAASDGLAALEGRFFNFDWRSEDPWFLYRCYYQTQAHFQGSEGKGPKWQEWNNLFSPTLIRQQFDDGHWETPSKQEAERFKGIDMPVYATSLCCLMLSVYYRYLPTFNLVGERKAEQAADPADEVMGLKAD